MSESEVQSEPEFDPTTTNPNPDPQSDFPGEQLSGQMLAHAKAEAAAQVPAVVPEDETSETDNNEEAPVGDSGDDAAPLEEADNLETSSPSAGDVTPNTVVPEGSSETVTPVGPVDVTNQS